MNVSFSCNDCGTRYTALPEQSGKKGTCKNCGSEIVVPTQETNKDFNKSAVMGMFRKSIKGLTSKIGIWLFVLVFLFFGLKSCIVTGWIPPGEPTTYAVHGADGRSLAMIFMPKNETYIVHTEQDIIETILTKMRGTYGTHYLWRLWSLDGPGTGEGLFEYRIYPEGAEPVVMEITVLDKFTYGNGNSTLGSKGDRTHRVILFAEDSIRFEGMWLEKEPTDMGFVSALNQRLRSQ